MHSHPGTRNPKPWALARSRTYGWGHIRNAAPNLKNNARPRQERQKLCENLDNSTGSSLLNPQGITPLN